MGLTLVTPATAEPLDLDLIRLHLKVTDSIEDASFQEYLQAACDWAENTLGRQLITATYDYPLDRFPMGDRIALPRPPLQSVTSITYYNEIETPAVFSSASYQVDVMNQPGRIVLLPAASWPTTTLRSANGVIIRLVTGYGVTFASVPPGIRQGLKLLIGHSWSERQPMLIGVSAQELPYGIWDYFGPYRLEYGVA